VDSDLSLPSLRPYLTNAWCHVLTRHGYRGIFPDSPMTKQMEPDDPVLVALYEKRRLLLESVDRVDRAIAEYVGEAASASVPAPARKTSAPPKKGAPISWTSEALKIVAEKGEPMHWKEILATMKKRGLSVPESGKARDIISGVLSRSARERKDFVHVGPGTFGLRVWGNGKRPHTAHADPSARESSTTQKLLDIISRRPGLTPAEIVSIFEQESDEDPNEAKSKRESRKTRVGQLVERGRVHRENGKYYPLIRL
jgi:hypothetical protein